MTSISLVIDRYVPCLNCVFQWSIIAFKMDWFYVIYNWLTTYVSLWNLLIETFMLYRQIFYKNKMLFVIFKILCLGFRLSNCNVNTYLEKFVFNKCVCK